MNINKYSFLKNFYLLLLAVIFLVAIFTPFLVGDISLIKEEYAEFIILAALLSLAYLVNILYKKEHIRYEKEIIKLTQNQKILEERLEDSFRYIGSLNVQIQQIESIFTKIDKYPESRKEVKSILIYLSKKILGIVNADWVILRILDVNSKQTLSEAYFSRGRNNNPAVNIANKDLINGLTRGLNVISSTDETFAINAYCVLPAETTKEQKTFIETIVNQAEMLFIIFSSAYYNEKK